LTPVSLIRVSSVIGSLTPFPAMMVIWLVYLPLVAARTSLASNGQMP
jgi:hypothetical protein